MSTEDFEELKLMLLKKLFLLFSAIFYWNNIGDMLYVYLKQHSELLNFIEYNEIKDVFVLIGVIMLVQKKNFICENKIVEIM